MRGPKPTPKSSSAPLPPEALTPPTDMSAAAQDEWCRIVKLLASSKVLGELDRGALRIYATSYALYVDAESAVNTQGTVVAGPTGTPVKNPYLQVQKDCWDRIRPLLAEFGLTPSARARLKLDHDGAEKSDEIVF